MKLYAASVSACKKTAPGTMTAGYGAIPIRAQNEHEALGLAYAAVYKDYSARDGWTNHVAVVSEIPKEWYAPRA